MNQTQAIIGGLSIAWIVFITVRGELPCYLNVLGLSPGTGNCPTNPAANPVSYNPQPSNQTPAPTTQPVSYIPAQNNNTLNFPPAQQPSEPAQQSAFNENISYNGGATWNGTGDVPTDTGMTDGGYFSYGE